MDLLLKNLRWHNGLNICSGDIRIHGGILQDIGDDIAPKKNEHVSCFNNHFIYPGLINSHDHLEMNLYPKLGRPPYSNYVEWANDIYKPNESPIKEIERLPIKDRLLWGGLKNLISGVATVVHHNPWHHSLGKDKFPVTVLKKIAWAHSIRLGKNIQRAFPKKNDIPFIIHAGEGIDSLSSNEVSSLQELGLIKKNTVLVHAIALEEKDIALLSENQSSVVWCPASNNYMFNRTAAVDKLKNNIRVALGSDSTLTGSPTLLDEIRAASKTGYADSKEIFAMVTTMPSTIFNLQAPQIAPLRSANFFIAPITNENYFENLMILTPKDIELIVLKGRPRLATAAYKCKALTNLINVQGALKYTDVEVGPLRKRIESNVGRSVLEMNPLWHLITA